MPPDEVGEVTRLLLAWSDGDEVARERLMEMVFQELREIARRSLEHERREHTLQPTALVNELYLKLVDRERVQLKNRAHFFAVAAEMMRQILVDHARARLTRKRGGEVLSVSLDEGWEVAERPDVELIALDDALQDLAQLDPRLARIVVLRFFAGLSHEEIAEVLAVSTSTVKREWRAARLWLHREISRK